MPTCAGKCTPVKSHWVKQFILTAKCTLAVQFKKSGLCIEYPGTTKAYYLQAVASDPGKFIWDMLYKKMPYKYIKLPCPPAVTTLCCANGIPATLHATQTGCIGSCVMTYNSVTDKWAGPMNFIGGRTKNLLLYCKDLGQGAGLHWYAEQSGCDTSGGIPQALNGSCSPFSQALPLSLSGCCGGADNSTLTFTI